MWISRQMANAPADAGADEGVVLAADGAEMKAGGTTFSRRVVSCQPYGYRAAVPKGERVLLLPLRGSLAALGVPGSTALPPGEVELCSLGGARIRLKNDGSIVFNNALTVTKEGEVLYGAAAD